jgi:hypothetical protein
MWTFMMKLDTRYSFILKETMPQVVKDLLEQFKDLWWSCELADPNLGRTYTLREKLEHEALFRRYLSILEAESKKMGLGELERLESKEIIYNATIDFTKSALDFEDQHIEAIRSYGFLEAVHEFARASRRYDPGLRDAEIFQASRNVWSMNLMQALMGLPVRITPSVFAYSLLYPYSDNYIDDPAIPTADKQAFNDRFRRRLEGLRITPANPHEAIISDLISRIEGEFDRSTYPGVYDSLLAIHLAQGKSLRLLHQNASPYEVDVLGMCFEKGGTSVLADGYLVSGQLTAAQREFMFYYGTFTQLIDDLEDVESDLQKGLMTVFSQTARHWPLDAVTNRTFHFWERVRQALEGFDSPQMHPLIELIGKYVPVMLVGEAGMAGKFYTRPYLRRLEAHCPFRFSFLIKEKRRLAKRGVSPLALVEAISDLNGPEIPA